MNKNNHILKRNATKVSIISNFCLIILKLFAGIISGSISIISEAIHSSTDLLASFIAYFAVIQSSKPADSDHPFGHGKYEYIASLFESLLIIFAGLCIAKQAFTKLYTSSEYSMDPNIGLVVMLVSVFVNYFVSKYLFNVAKITNSPAIMADGTHLSTDIFSSVAVIIGLAMVKLTGLVFFDALIALIVTVIIILAGIDIYKKARENLLDTALEVSQIEDIKNIINSFPEVKIKNLKTRKTGLYKNIEITLLIDGNMTVNEAHKLCDRIELDIDKKLNDTEISIHMEPLNTTVMEVV